MRETLDTCRIQYQGNTDLPTIKWQNRWKQYSKDNYSYKYVIINCENCNEELFFVIKNHELTKWYLKESSVLSDKLKSGWKISRERISEEGKIRPGNSSWNKQEIETIKQHLKKKIKIKKSVNI